MTNRLILPLAVAAVGLVTFGLPLAVNAADETCSCSARKEWVAIRAAEMRAEREAAAKAEAEAVAEKAAAEEVAVGMRIAAHPPRRSVLGR